MTLPYTKTEFALLLFEAVKKQTQVTQETEGFRLSDYVPMI